MDSLSYEEILQILDRQVRKSRTKDIASPRSLEEPFVMELLGMRVRVLERREKEEEKEKKKQGFRQDCRDFRRG
ncbi:hypothetical protein H5410_012323 [Solanum commersonii]|uniref:Uncharacterized protein n=1 Tax=Solanum commersonii TaxID=4109 RepID=A0A9J6AS21_SOLCO|nr:hypothetical protein H5410_012323 [Solanum commersonii]